MQGVEEKAKVPKQVRNPLRLAFGLDGGGSSIETTYIPRWRGEVSRVGPVGVETENSTSGSHFEKVHLRLTFVRKGGGGGGRSVERSRNSTSSLRLYAREVEEMATASKSTSGSHLYTREVEKVGGVSKGRKSPPPARIWTRGRWRRRQRRRNRQHPSLEGKGSLRRPSVLAQPS